MTFKEIEQAVVKRQPLHSGASLHEQMCFITLRSLYTDYSRRVVDQRRATMEKKEIAHAFQEAQAKDQISARLRADWVKGVQASDELRCELQKGILSGMDAEELLLIACECVAAATGDRTLSKEKVKRQRKK